MLQDCNISRISIDVLGKYTMNQQIRAASPVGLSIDAFATCSVLIDTSEPIQRPTYFELIGPDVTAFLSRNKTSSASLWWGESMLYMYWLVAAKAYMDSAEDTEAGKSQTYNAAITLERRDPAEHGTAEEAMSDDFFATGCFVEASYCGTNVTSDLGDPAQAKEKWHPYPSIWRPFNLLGATHHLRQAHRIHKEMPETSSDSSQNSPIPYDPEDDESEAPVSKRARTQATTVISRAQVQQAEELALGFIINSDQPFNIFSDSFLRHLLILYNPALYTQVA